MGQTLRPDCTFYYERTGRKGAGNSGEQWGEECGAGGGGDVCGEHES